MDEKLRKKEFNVLLPKNGSCVRCGNYTKLNKFGHCFNGCPVRFRLKPSGFV